MPDPRGHGPHPRLRPPGLLALLLIGLTLPAGAVPHAVDPDRGEIVVHTDRSGLFGFAGHRHRIEAGSYSGVIDVDPETLNDISVRLTISAGELVVADDEDSSTVAKVEAEMRENVLEVDTYPTITFASATITSRRGVTEGVRELEVTGDLDLHGETRSISFQAFLAVVDGEVHVVGDVTITQTDFGIEPVSVGLGTVKVKDEVTIAFDVWATAARSPSPGGG